MRTFLTADALLAAAREQKLEAQRDNMPMAPMLVLGGQSYGVKVVPFPYSTIELDAVADQLRAMFRDTWYAAYCADAYYEEIKADDRVGVQRLKHHQRGNLTARFNNGDPRVVEAIVVTLCERFRPPRSIFVPYVMTDNVPVFADDPVFGDSEGVETLGLVPEALDRLVAP